VTPVECDGFATHLRGGFPMSLDVDKTAAINTEFGGSSSLQDIENLDDSSYLLREPGNDKEASLFRERDPPTWAEHIRSHAREVTFVFSVVKCASQC